jgi:RNA-directed DNA polymerase
MGTCDHDANGEATSADPTRARVRMRDGRDGTARISDEVSHKGMEPRRCVEEPDFDEPTSNGRSPMNEAKPFCISKKEVWEAYQRVKTNKGSAGIDGQTIEDFEKRLKKNLYRIWNRMSSGSYFPPPVRTVKIPKKSGGERSLGIPTVGDRIAQQVVKARLEPGVDPHFHPDSYGYRPARSALDAVGQARQRCWRNDWVLDLDIRAFFDNLDQNLLLRAVKKHASQR